MSEATISKVQELFANIAALFSRIGGVGFWLFMAGFVLILIMLAALVLKLLIAIAKAIPNLTVGQFIKLMLALALVLIIVGLFIP